MSQKALNLRLLTGGLNLLSPADKIPREDCQQLENFRADQFGALRSRPGFSTISATGDASGRVHTLYRWGDVFFIGAGTNIYRYPDVSTPLTASLSGQPFGMAFMNGYGWVMDQNLQFKTTGNSVLSWGVLAPSSVLTATSSGDDSSLDGLTGTYKYLVTFATSDGAESNPSSASAEVVLLNADCELSQIPISLDPEVVSRYIYREGGLLGQPYQVGQLTDNSSTTFLDKMSDADATKAGIAISFDRDAPPAASGLVGPYFGRLIAFCSQDKPNRLWWTEPGIPDYFPGAAVNSGNWVDVGDDNEAIVQITIKSRHAIIYKQRSIWRLNGDPDTGTLERVNSKYSLAGRNAVADGGAIDYCLFAEGFYVFDGDRSEKLSLKLDPVFQDAYVSIGSELSISPLDTDRRAQAALEYANDRLLVSYPESTSPGGGNSVTVIYDIPTGRSSMVRMTSAEGFDGGFTVLRYVHPEMWGGNQNKIVNIQMSQTRTEGGFEDPGGPIVSFWQSRFEDCGQPDLDKVLTDVVIEVECGSGTPTVILLRDNGSDPSPAYLSAIGSLIAPVRTKVTFSLATEETAGITAKNFAVRVEGTCSSQIVLHSITLYYYLEVPALNSASAKPFMLSDGGVFEVKELQVDSSNPGEVQVRVFSDLPGNSLAVRRLRSLSRTSTRRPYNLPFSTMEGRLFQVTCLSDVPFRLYKVRMLVRPIGVYVEGYEGQAGFVWDSMDLDFSRGVHNQGQHVQQSLYTNPIKRVREIELQIETAGAATVRILSDLPGDYMGLRWEKVIDTSLGSGSRVLRIPLPSGTDAPVEGRMFRLQISSAFSFKLFAASFEILTVGVYLEAYEAAGGAIYDSREVDLGSKLVKEIREFEFDIESPGAVKAELFSDQPGGLLVLRWSKTFSAVRGRRRIASSVGMIEGKLVRLIISSTDQFALYEATATVRAFGQYLTADSSSSGSFWDSTEIDLGTESAKHLRELELKWSSSGPVTVNVYTDLPDGVLSLRFSIELPATGSYRAILIPLPQGVIGNLSSIYGRLLRVTVGGSSAVKLFGARVQFRPIGLYIGSIESKGGAVWDSMPIVTSSQDRVFDLAVIEMDADSGPISLSVYSDHSTSEASLQFSTIIASSQINRQLISVPLPMIEGRSIRLVISGNQNAAAFCLFKVHLRSRYVGRYIAAAGSGLGSTEDGFRTLDYDFGSEHVKLFKKVEIDLQTSASVTVTVTTDSGSFTHTAVQTGGVRKALKFTLPMNFRGRLLNIAITSKQSALLFHLRVWMRPVALTGAGWSWVDYPLEAASVVPEWSEIPIPVTPDTFSWAPLDVPPTAAQWVQAPFPVAETPAQWSWAKVDSVIATPIEWTWITVPGLGSVEVE